MKLFFICAALLAIPQTAAKLLKTPPAYKSLDEVYGSHNLNKKVLDRNALRAGRIARSGMASNDNWLAARTPDQCTFPVALHLLIDSTANMAGDTEQAVLDSFPALGTFLQQHPGSTFSISYFRDKPVEGLGESTDYCLKTAVVDVPDMETISSSYEGETSEGGGDWLNNHLGAVIQVVKSPITIPWMSDPLKTRLVLVITNTAPHFAGDGGEADHSQLTNYTAFHEDAMEKSCKEIYYPAPVDVKLALRQTNAYLGVVVLDSDSKERWAFKAFDWLNTYLNQPNDMLAEQASPGAIDKQLQRVLSGLERAECGDIVTKRREAKAAKASLQKFAHSRMAASADTTTTLAATEECPEPSPSRCTQCIEDGGCCKGRGPSPPKLLIALKNRPQEILIEASLPTAGAAAKPLVVPLDEASDNVEIEA